MTESSLYSPILQACSQGNTRIFRQNAGLSWQGEVIKQTREILILRNPRPIKLGCAGMADLGGLTSVIITPDMIGQRIGIDIQLEVKSRTGRARPEQINYIDTMLRLGARAGIVRSVDEALAVILGKQP